MTTKRNHLRNHREPWTTEQQDRLVEMFYKGVPVSQMAQRTGRTAGAVVTRLASLGHLKYDGGVMYTVPRPYFNVFSNRHASRSRGY